MINKKIELKQIILGSLLISFALILSKINNLFMKNIHFFKMPFSQVSFWAFWHLPLIIICLFFTFYYSFLFILIYIILFSYFFSFPSYVIISNFSFPKSESSYINIICMELFGHIIPTLGYLFLSFFIKIKIIKNNYKKIIFIFILIILWQSISRVRVGWFWLNVYKNQFQIYSNIKIFFIIFFYNIIPIFISNVINFILILFLKTKIIKLYDYYLENEFY